LEEDSSSWPTRCSGLLFLEGGERRIHRHDPPDVTLYLLFLEGGERINVAVLSFGLSVSQFGPCSWYIANSPNFRSRSPLIKMEKKETPFGGTRWGSKRKLMEEPELKKKILVAITEDGPLCEFYTVKKHVKLDDCRKLVKKLFAYAKDTSRGERRAVEGPPWEAPHRNPGTYDCARSPEAEAKEEECWHAAFRRSTTKTTLRFARWIKNFNNYSILHAG
jgi:hypothetical protein